MASRMVAAPCCSGVRNRLGVPYDRALAAPGALQDDRASDEVRAVVQQAAHEVLRRAEH
ncbi:hypothetical protein [Myceligenerans halotolerans]